MHYWIDVIVQFCCMCNTEYICYTLQTMKWLDIVDSPVAISLMSYTYIRSVEIL